MMTEAMMDLLWVTDSTITIVLKFVAIILVFKLIITKRNYIKELNKWQAYQKH